MNEQRFQRLLEIYGADLERWPSREGLEAERYLAGSAQARSAVRREAGIDRLLADCAPLIEEGRADRLIGALMSRVETAATPAAGLLPWEGWRWSPNQGVVYASLFALGCIANLAGRLFSAAAPLDLLFSNNLLLP